MKTKIILSTIILLFMSCSKEDMNILSDISKPVESRSTYVLSGKIIWEHDDITGVANIPIQLTGDGIQTSTTDSNGNYSFSVSAGNYVVTPSVPTQGTSVQLLNGVTLADATVIQNHIVSLVPITDPYKKIAADALKSNTITSADVAVVRQAVLGNLNALFQLNPSWKFVDASYPLINPSHVGVPVGYPQSISVVVTGDTFGINFIGIKRGDVDGSCNPSL